MSKESQPNLFKEQIDLIEELKQKMTVVESAMGMISEATEEMAVIENIVKEVKEKLALMEKKVIQLLNTLTVTYQNTENKLISLEKRINALEMKESLIKQAYHSDNMGN